MNALRLAFGLLTAVPVGRLPQVDRHVAGRAMLLAPVTTAPLLALLGGAHLTVSWGAPPPVAAALVVTAGAMLTRGLHLDGLADTADGLSAGYDAQTSLRAMKASDTGPSGVAAVVLALLLQVTALAALLPLADGTALAAAAWLVSRHTLAQACRQGVPAAQEGGLGAMVAGTVRKPALLVASAVVAVVSVLGVLAAHEVAAASPAPHPAGAVASVVGAVGALGVVVVGLAAAALLTRRCRVRLGGITGDVLGAGVEVSLTAALVTAALLVSF